jgi:type III pantothenate kinase
MNLIIDSGNSFTKLALFEKAKLLESTKISKPKAFEAIEQLMSQNKIDRAIAAETADLEAKTLAFLNGNLSLLRLGDHTKLPFENLYETPETLGADRLALAASAQHFFPKENVLVIDAGTCITYDFIENGKTYHGGAISPGLKMRYRSMSHFTQKLPLLKPSAHKNLEIIGKNTETNLHSGVLWGTSLEIDGYINRLKTQYKKLNVVLTGGDAKLLVNRLKNSIFAPSHFLENGLNQILEFNCLDE